MWVSSVKWLRYEYFCSDLWKCHIIILTGNHLAIWRYTVYPIELFFYSGHFYTIERNICFFLFVLSNSLLFSRWFYFHRNYFNKLWINSGKNWRSDQKSRGASCLQRADGRHFPRAPFVWVRLVHRPPKSQRKLLGRTKQQVHQRLMHPMLPSIQEQF